MIILADYTTFAAHVRWLKRSNKLYKTINNIRK